MMPAPRLPCKAQTKRTWRATPARIVRMAAGMALLWLPRHHRLSIALPVVLRKAATGDPGRPVPATDKNNIALACRRKGDGHAGEVEKGMQQAGLPPGLLKATGSDPWASMDSRVMMGGMAEFARRSRLVGTETVNGRSAFHPQADGMNRMQVADGQESTIQSASLWIDTQEYVPLRTKMDGVANSRGESRPITIEKFDGDCRHVSGSKMYEPCRQVMRGSGLMGAEQKAQMAEAQQKIAEMEQQLQQMMPSQRDMIMAQRGPQMAMMNQMQSGGFETIAETRQIIVNPANGPAADGSSGIPCGRSGSVSAAGAMPAPVAQAGGQDTNARQACLQEKVQKAQAAQKKQRGMRRLLGAVSRAPSMLGKADVAQAVGKVDSANATASDLVAAARDLGLTEDEIAAFQNPG